MTAENTYSFGAALIATAENQRRSPSRIPALARVQLRKQGVALTSVKKKPKPLINLGAKKIAPADIAIFTRQLATMVKAGVPLVQAFSIVADGTDHPKMRELIITIQTDVSSGAGLAGALTKHSLFR